MMETRLIPKKFLKLIKNLADENRNYKKIFGNVFWLEVVKEKNYSWFNLRLNSRWSTLIRLGGQLLRSFNSPRYLTTFLLYEVRKIKMHRVNFINYMTDIAARTLYE